MKFSPIKQQIGLPVLQASGGFAAAISFRPSVFRFFHWAILSLTRFCSRILGFYDNHSYIFCTFQRRWWIMDYLKYLNSSLPGDSSIITVYLVHPRAASPVLVQITWLRWFLHLFSAGGARGRCNQFRESAAALIFLAIGYRFCSNPPLLPIPLTSILLQAPTALTNGSLLTARAGLQAQWVFVLALQLASVFLRPTRLLDLSFAIAHLLFPPIPGRAQFFLPMLAWEAHSLPALPEVRPILPWT